MKKPTKKLSVTTQTIRHLQDETLAQIAGGSLSVFASSGTSVIAPSGGITSLLPSTSANPSGGRH